MGMRTLAYCVAICCSYGALFAVVFLPTIATGLLAPADGIDNYYPSLLSPDKGWSPYLFCGYPTFADPQELTWYPPAWLFLRLLGSWNAFVVAGYAIAAGGMHVFVHRQTGSHSAATFSALTFSLGGFLIGHLRHVTIVHAAAWLPWLLIAVQGLQRAAAADRSLARGTAALSGFTAALLLAGHPQIQLYALTFVAIVCVVLARAAAPRTLRFLAATTCGTLLGVALFSVQLLPLLELTTHAVRQQLSFAEFGSFALPVQQLPMLVAPLSFGNPLQQYTGAWSFEELSGYAGLLPLLAVLAYAARPTRDPLFWCCVGLSVIGVALALGNSFVGAGLYHVPGFQKFRAPARHLIEWSAGLSIAAGIAFAHLRVMTTARRQRAIQRSLFCAAAVVGITTLAVWLISDPSLLAIAAPLLLFALLAIAIRWWGAQPDRRRTAALIALVFVDLVSVAYFAEWRRPVPVAATAPPPLVAELKQQLATTNMRCTPLLGTRQPLENGTPNRTRLWNLPSTNGFNPLRLRRYAELTGIDLAGVIQPAILRDEDATLDILSSRYILLPTVLEDRCSASTRFQKRDDLSASLTASVVFENLRARPRAWLAYDATVLDDATAIETLRSSRWPDGTAFDPELQAIVAAPLPTTLGLPDADHRVTIAELDSLRQRVATQSDTTALLVISDIHYPGWIATVDDKPAVVHRVNHVLRGVVVPAGEHTVTLEFQPRSQRNGFLLSGIALIVVCALLLRRDRHGRTATPSNTATSTQ